MFPTPFTLKIENAYGKLFELTRSTQKYVVTAVTGLLYPETNINTSSGIADGSQYNSARMQERNIVITLRLRGAIEASRQYLYTIFPPKMPCKLYWKSRNRDVRISGYVELVEGDLFSEQETMQVSIICPKPYFEGLAAIQEELSSSIRLFEFPFTIEEPIPISEHADVPRITLQNNGDVSCGLTAEIGISGDVTGLRLYNAATGQLMRLTENFQEGDRIFISTISGEKEVTLYRNGTQSSLLAKLASGSKWVQLLPGNNEIILLTDEGTDYVRVILTAAEMFGGV